MPSLILSVSFSISIVLNEPIWLYTRLLAITIDLFVRIGWKATSFCVKALVSESILFSSFEQLVIRANLFRSICYENKHYFQLWIRFINTYFDEQFQNFWSAVKSNLWMSFASFNSLNMALKASETFLLSSKPIVISNISVEVFLNSKYLSVSSEPLSKYLWYKPIRLVSTSKNFVQFSISEAIIEDRPRIVSKSEYILSLFESIRKNQRKAMDCHRYEIWIQNKCIECSIKWLFECLAQTRIRIISI